MADRKEYFESVALRVGLYLGIPVLEYEKLLNPAMTQRWPGIDGRLDN